MRLQEGVEVLFLIIGLPKALVGIILHYVLGKQIKLTQDISQLGRDILLERVHLELITPTFTQVTEQLTTTYLLIAA